MTLRPRKDTRSPGLRPYCPIKGTVVLVTSQSTRSKKAYRSSSYRKADRKQPSTLTSLTPSGINRSQSAQHSTSGSLSSRTIRFRCGPGEEDETLSMLGSLLRRKGARRIDGTMWLSASCRCSGAGSLLRTSRSGLCSCTCLGYSERSCAWRSAAENGLMRAACVRSLSMRARVKAQRASGLACSSTEPAAMISSVPRRLAAAGKPKYVASMRTSVSAIACSNKGCTVPHRMVQGCLLFVELKIELLALYKQS